METTTLTKLATNTNHPRVAQDLRDPQRMHQTITAIACPPDLGPSSRAAVDLLYRLDRGGSEILIQSRTPLNTDDLPSGYLLAGKRDLAPLMDRLDTNTTVHYKIAANPTVTRNGRKLPITDPDHATDWWHRTATTRGLHPNTIAITDTTKASGTKRGGTKLTITTTVFTGTGTVTDADTLRDSIRSGIGRAKAYGCGLLSLVIMR